MLNPASARTAKESPRVTTEDDDTAYVCHDCIGDPFLAEDVRAEGTRATCSYCGEVREALVLGDLVVRS